jgi:oxygen-independent coproporphyrinogen-3 oxidase
LPPVPFAVRAPGAAPGVLHRNFMGYTTRPASDMVGVGVSSIGDVQGAFAQNTKKLSTYYAALDAGRFPIERGYELTRDDEIRRYVITQLMCNFRVGAHDTEQRFGVVFEEYFQDELRQLRDGPAVDGLVKIDGEGVEVTELGRLIVRNVCMAFDRHLARHTNGAPVFSRTI